ncbi:uncharacterized protein LOC114877200 [Osmia bicornis bicornis]|uniref:uncharacterized protein LOC114877200 n=1 Tax=Osmia bicornis bicornis TaxID=1437191 RepID=UPI0010F7E0A2|nr:uncharacterized protein LOC114877200 [Osmia bicornis bicornis]
MSVIRDLSPLIIIRTTGDEDFERRNNRHQNIIPDDLGDWCGRAPSKSEIIIARGCFIARKIYRHINLSRPRLSSCITRHPVSEATESVLKAIAGQHQPSHPVRSN